MKGDALRITARSFIGLCFIAAHDGARCKDIKAGFPHVFDVHNWLAQMVQTGYVHQPDFGRYSLTAKGKSVVDQVEFALSWTKQRKVVA